MRLTFLSILFAFVCIPLSAQQTPSSTTPSAPQSASDPQAVAVVQAAITAIGGATAVSALQSWTFQAQAQGRVANGAITEVLASSIPQNSNQPAGTTAKAPPPWARPRSLFVPALVSAILATQSQDSTVLLNQGAASASVPNANVVIFSAKGKSGAVPTQKWYFDKTSSLPNRIDFLLPAHIGSAEAFPGTVVLSNYQNVGGILYPFQIVTFLQRTRVVETITVQSVTPSTNPPAATPVASNKASGGVQ